MSTSKLSQPNRDKAPHARTGHGTASVIARLNEQISQLEPLAMDGPADEPAAREPSPTEIPATIDPNPRLT